MYALIKRPVLKKIVIRTYINLKERDQSSFSEHELEVLHMIAFEYTTDEIMLETHCDLSEVKSIVSSLYAKLDASTYVGLIRAAYEKGILKLW